MRVRTRSSGYVAATDVIPARGLGMCVGIWEGGREGRREGGTDGGREGEGKD